jgi:hypothetical protein
MAGVTALEILAQQGRACFFRTEQNEEGIKRYRVDRSKRIDITGSPICKGMKNTVCGLRTDKVFMYLT